MWLPLLTLILGMAIGFLTKLNLPAAYSDYLAISLLAALDSVFGGIRAGLSRTFTARTFISGFFTNILIAVFLTYLGYRLGVDLMLPASVAFGIRIFQNLGIIRNLFLNRSSIKSGMKSSE